MSDPVHTVAGNISSIPPSGWPATPLPLSSPETRKTRSPVVGWWRVLKEELRLWLCGAEIDRRADASSFIYTSAITNLGGGPLQSPAQLSWPRNALLYFWAHVYSYLSDLNELKRNNRSLHACESADPMTTSRPSARFLRPPNPIISAPPKSHRPQPSPHMGPFGHPHTLFP
jgi:hypothetical protein